MSRWHAYLNSGKQIIDAYDGRVPLAVWLKDYFRAHKQMGGTDRKMIAELVYSFYRLGHAAPEVPADLRMLMAVFCCNREPHPLLHHLKPEWNALVHLPLPEKAAILQQEAGDTGLDIPLHIFPCTDELSEGLDATAFSESFLQQPDLFLRLRPGKEMKVREQLSSAGIAFQSIGDQCVALPNATKAETIVAIGEDAIVQDYSSQRTGAFLGTGEWSASPTPVLWDCCAASGGKSIMAHDLNPAFQLIVSDKRESIMQNLHERFRRAGIMRYSSFVADFAQPGAVTARLEPDLILADLPCSGSGTWARTPEQLYFFKTKQIDYYSNLQKRMLSNIIPMLKPGGHLVYITCSVFKAENEEVVRFIQDRFSLQLLQMELLQGYPLKADTLFAARFERV